MKFFPIIPLAAMLAMAEEPKIEFDEFKARMDFQIGHIVKGENREAGQTPSPLDFMPLYRNIVVLEEDGTLGESWSFAAGLKGIMWWPYSTDQSTPLTRTIRIEPKPSILKLSYNFGSGDNRSFLDLGYFPYKYNRDAKNLGEYLYRSGTYPGILYNSDGFQLMDHAYFDAYGARLRWSNLRGLITHDFNLFMETQSFPVEDFTPAYELSVNLPHLQLGVGAAYNRGLSFAPSQSISKDPANEYVEVQADPSKGIKHFIGPFPDTANPAGKDASIPFTVLHRWNERGIKLMGRASLDLGFLLPENLRGSEDLRLYTEVAVLGWENQPFYYEKRFERMPIMAGLNFPTLRLLDVLAFQVEYYASPFNGTKDFNDTSKPIWTVQDYESNDRNYFKPNNWKWSLYASKSVNRLLTFKGQVANDHLRPHTFDGFSLTNFDLTQGPGNWYYLVQMEVGI